VFGVERSTALVVDDEFYIVDLLADILADEGFQVLRAYDGLSALAIAEETPVDLVVADVMMPKMDGIALALRLRQRFARMRILLMSAAVTQVPPGFEFIAKPFDINELDGDRGRTRGMRREAVSPAARG
jgi:DNA-binding response OmpR family regulator